MVDEYAIGDDLHVFHVYDGVHEDEEVRILLCRNLAHAERLLAAVPVADLNEVPGNAVPVLLVANKTRTRHGPGLTFCVVDTLTGEGVSACMERAKTLVR